ncbi:pseudouridine synthase, partial [Agrocybe pediades]
TTGCLVIPLNSVVAREISIQIKQKTFQKTYLALVRGGEKSFDTKSGRLQDHLLYTDGRGSVDKSGKEAITDWELLSSSKKAPISLLMFKLVTGKKHQLRLHASKVLKAPILGDGVYSLSNVSQSILDVTTVPENRLFLHAHEVSLFKYREDGKRYRLGVRAPLPNDFQRICKELDIPLPPLFTKPSLIIDGQVAGKNSDLKLWNALDAEQLIRVS